MGGLRILSAPNGRAVVWVRKLKRTVPVGRSLLALALIWTLVAVDLFIGTRNRLVGIVVALLLWALLMILSTIGIVDGNARVRRHDPRR